MYAYAFLLEYDGGGFSGWQLQKDAVSVQEVLGMAALQLTGQETLFHGAGRTDAGVHALGQVAHALFSKFWPADRLRLALNFYLKGQGVVILDAQPVSADFHARFSACGRRYCYRVLARPSISVLEQDRVWWVCRPLDLEVMQKGADLLRGTHDFQYFRSSECGAKTAVKTLDQATVQGVGQEYQFHFQARSFLHHQVRMMTGTLVKLGMGNLCFQDIRDLIRCIGNKGRVLTAPAQGLFLKNILYSDKIFTEN
jgi:tRNA pseudouridine38-40 synthase